MKHGGCAETLWDLSGGVSASVGAIGVAIARDSQRDSGGRASPWGSESDSCPDG